MSVDFLAASIGSPNTTWWIFINHQVGNAWLEYHGLFHGERPTKFNAIIGVSPRVATGFQVEVPVMATASRESMLVDVAEFVQLPQGVVPVALQPRLYG